METKPATMNTIPILYDLFISILTNPTSKARSVLGESFTADLLKRTSLTRVAFPQRTRRMKSTRSSLPASSSSTATPQATSSISYSHLSHVSPRSSARL